MTLRSLGIGARVTWANLPGRPAVFPPAAHTHPWSDLTSVPTSFPPSAHTHAWGEITGKPNLYPPAAHTHLWADITDKPATFAPAAHTHAWTEITGKPTVFAPAAHTHVWADITDRPTIPAPTPLGSAAPKALGTAAAGSSSNAAREDHAHPMPSGRMEFIGNLNVAETLVLALSVGMKRKTFALAGVQAADLLVFAPTAAPTAGCEVVNVYPAGAGNISVGYYTPALGIAAAYSMPIAVYRVT